MTEVFVEQPLASPGSANKHRAGRLAKCREPRKLGLCQIVKAWVKFVTEHTFFSSSICCFNFSLFLGKSFRKYRAIVLFRYLLDNY